MGALTRLQLSEEGPAFRAVERASGARALPQREGSDGEGSDGGPASGGRIQAEPRPLTHPAARSGAPGAPLEHPPLWPRRPQLADPRPRPFAQSGVPCAALAGPSAPALWAAQLLAAPLGAKLSALFSNDAPAGARAAHATAPLGARGGVAGCWSLGVRPRPRLARRTRRRPSCCRRALPPFRFRRAQIPQTRPPRRAGVAPDDGAAAGAGLRPAARRVRGLGGGFGGKAWAELLAGVRGRLRGPRSKGWRRRAPASFGWESLNLRLQPPAPRAPQPALIDAGLGPAAAACFAFGPEFARAARGAAGAVLRGEKLPALLEADDAGLWLAWVDALIGAPPPRWVFCFVSCSFVFVPPSHSRCADSAAACRRAAGVSRGARPARERPAAARPRGRAAAPARRLLRPCCPRPPAAAPHPPPCAPPPPPPRL
jgi:hypothetical protein